MKSQQRAIVEERKKPCLNLFANEDVDTSTILSEATSTVAKLVGKPEAYVMIVLKGADG